MNTLPVDMLRVIVSHLSFSELLDVVLVSKEWGATLIEKEVAGVMVKTSDELSPIQKDFMMKKISSQGGAITVRELTRWASLSSEEEIGKYIFSETERVFRNLVRAGHVPSSLDGLRWVQLESMHQFGLSREQVVADDFLYETYRALRDGLPYEQVVGLSARQLELMSKQGLTRAQVLMVTGIQQLLGDWMLVLDARTSFDPEHFTPPGEGGGGLCT